MKQILQHILTLLVTLMAYTNMYAQTVTNVEAQQEGQNIVITFNMDKPCTPTIMFSTTGKNGSFNIIPEKKKKKIIRPGTEYKYLWKVTEQFEEFSYENVVFKVFPGKISNIISYPLVKSSTATQRIKTIIFSDIYTAIEIVLDKELLWMKIDKNTYVVADGVNYYLKKADGIEVSPQKTEHPKSGDTFTLYFAPITAYVWTIDLIEPNSSWVWHGINVGNAASTGQVHKNGVLKGVFSVSPTKKIAFSQGNLQYQASTGIWRFAEQQYYVCGENNTNISPYYNGWIDLFGWGTSGAYSMKPYKADTTETYASFGDIAEINYDWGVYNKISNGGDKAGIWRTLTHAEWYYLIYTRENAQSKSGLACVNGVQGLILLPDNWALQSVLKFTCGKIREEDIFGINLDYASYKIINNYTADQWKKMEANGAVFLPIAGDRFGTYVENVVSAGIYWSSSSEDDKYAPTMLIDRYENKVLYRVFNKRLGCSVRLVQDVK